MAKTLSDRDVVEKRNHVEMMKRTQLWPQWPMLPVKRWTGRDMECAVLLDVAEGKKYTLYFANLYMLPDDLTTCQQREYDSFEAIVADGWEVD